MSLIAHAKRIAAQEAQAESDGMYYPAANADADLAYEDACPGGGRDARDVLLLAALIHSFGPAGLRRLQSRKGLAIVIQIPGPEWVPGVALALRGLTPIAKILARTGAHRSQDKPTEGNDRVAMLLAQGAKVAGVSHPPECYLPTTLVGAADLKGLHLRGP